MEYIAGPIHGFYLACYTVPTHDGHHYGYAKICTVYPESIWDAGIAVRKVGAGPFATEEQAIVAVQAEARRRLAARAAYVEILVGQQAAEVAS
jgi:hypothetical protein